ncbi:MAG: UDP-N-acetylglucosamine 2-epimerase (non-hydrolyzing) [SAR202 cluster bacterium]|nr:UDP-N-acetylglucosamine 2-epimerase (non-hydrolyzing) [Chloroflexota bacterium]MQG35899.1 UDP-N-acetylglucosamine 2-epimerase (non-hydrolyzing) [SAR202 cluster bacterium]MQG86719.1 UDP-N-acetylglucosamine 2-epimerase (non-hydrolyzing) [SAR202 cluster bacterium]|tara:strand:- start:21722 stop:22849 length:1128 start_codon:yes stop_codon:yes gene_type:complete
MQSINMANNNKILHIVGARPNFIKAAPLIKALKNQPNPCEQLLIHTGQHFDSNMSGIFFNELNLPMPDINLEVSGGNGLQQLSEMLIRIEKPITEFKPDSIIVYGDTNSTLAGALAGSKLSIPVAHVEAGLRSRDYTMPEEINRIITDNISSYLFTPSEDANSNLTDENIKKDHIYFVGNIMIDTLISSMKKIDQSLILQNLNLQSQGSEKIIPYNILTLHRPSNVDDDESLATLLGAVSNLPPLNPIIFPVHPRAEGRIRSITKNINSNNMICIQPLGYIDFLCLLKNANAVITDSGGIQEETTYLKTTCITLRSTTERPITVSKGTNTLINPNEPGLTELIRDAIDAAHSKDSVIPDLWDGKTSQRIVDILLK